METDGAVELSLALFLRDEFGVKVGTSCLYQFCAMKFPPEPGIYRCSLPILPPWLASGGYSIDIATSLPNIAWDHYLESAVRFHIPFSNPLARSWEFRQSDNFGPIAIPFADTPVITPDRRYPRHEMKPVPIPSS